MLAAFLALVVPVFFMLAWWSICLPVMIAEDAGVMESFGRSLDLTSGHVGQILLAILVSFAPAIFGIVVITISYVTLPFPLALESVVLNTTLSVSQILWWFVQIEIYSELYKSSTQMS